MCVCVCVYIYIYMASLVVQLVKESACTVGNLVLSLVWEDSPGEGNGYLLQYSCLGDLMDRGAWRAIFHGVTRVGHDLVIKPPL